MENKKEAEKQKLNCFVSLIMHGIKVEMVFVVAMISFLSSKKLLQELSPFLLSLESFNKGCWNNHLLESSLASESKKALQPNPIPSDGFGVLSKLQILDLCGITASLPEPPAFSCLPQVQELYLRCMQLYDVPSDLVCLQQLQILDLNQNSLVSVPKLKGSTGQEDTYRICRTFFDDLGWMSFEEVSMSISLFCGEPFYGTKPISFLHTCGTKPISFLLTLEASSNELYALF